MSLPSNTTQTFAAEALTRACIATSSPCSRRNSRSYCFLLILACGFALRRVRGCRMALPEHPRRDAWFSWPPRPPSARPRLGTPSQRHVLLDEVTGAQPPTHVSTYPEGQCQGRPDTCLSRHPVGVNRTSKARPACLATSGLAIGWAAGMLQAGILVGAWAPVRFLTHRCIDQPDARTFGAASLRSDAVEGRYRTPAIGTVADVDGLQAAQPEAGMELDLMRWG